MLKTALALHRDAMLAGGSLQGARAALIGNRWRFGFDGLALRGGILGGNQRQGRLIAGRSGGLDDDFAHGFAATSIEQQAYR